MRKKRFELLAAQHVGTGLELIMASTELKFERENLLRSRNELLEAKHIIDDLRTQLIEANGELMDMRMRTAL